MTWRYKSARQSQPRRIGRCRVHGAGFTLIELLVAFAVLGLALSLIAGFKPPWSRGLGLRATAAELAMGLRLARSEAILSNRPVVLDLDLAGHRYRVGTGTPRRLPADLSLELLTISGEALNGRASLAGSLCSRSSWRSRSPRWPL